MKKRIISILLCLCMALALLPTTSAAFTQTYVKTMDLTIEMPKAGMTQRGGGGEAALCQDALRRPGR